MQTSNFLKSIFPGREEVFSVDKNSIAFILHGVKKYYAVPFKKHNILKIPTNLMIDIKLILLLHTLRDNRSINWP